MSKLLKLRGFVFCTTFISMSFAHAAVLRPTKSPLIKDTKKKEIILNSIYEEIYELTKDLVKVIPEKKKASVNEGLRGKMLIEKIKQQNREKLALMRGVDPGKVKSGQDIVNLQKEDNKQLLNKIREAAKDEGWARLAKSEVEALRKKVIIQHKEWKKKHLSTLKSWQEKKKKYMNEVDSYKKTLASIPKVVVQNKDLKEEKKVEINKEDYIVAGSLSVPVRDQKYRPTCSSFSGIRAIEILLNQNSAYNDLSEQYFYWASKSDCQDKKCTQRGSWVGHGLNFSKQQRSIDIPLEKNCPYKAYSEDGNETQIPLSDKCEQGVVRVEDFNYFRNTDSIIHRLKQNQPVIVSLKLTPNFYGSHNLILNKDKYKKGEMDKHAQGHSILLVGYVKLPQILNEGRVCFIAVNSWGEGWGNGGYSCLSENWLMDQKQTNPFVSINSVQN